MTAICSSLWDRGKGREGRKRERGSRVGVGRSAVSNRLLRRSLRSVFVVLISDFKYLLLTPIPISPQHGAGDQHWWDALAVYIREGGDFLCTQNDGKGCRRAVSECRKRSPNARHFSRPV